MTCVRERRFPCSPNPPLSLFPPRGFSPLPSPWEDLSCELPSPKGKGFQLMQPCLLTLHRHVREVHFCDHVLSAAPRPVLDIVVEQHRSSVVSTLVIFELESSAKDKTAYCEPENLLANPPLKRRDCANAIVQTSPPRSLHRY